MKNDNRRYLSRRPLWCHYFWQYKLQATSGLSSNNTIVTPSSSASGMSVDNAILSTSRLFSNNNTAVTPVLSSASGLSVYNAVLSTSGLSSNNKKCNGVTTKRQQATASNNTKEQGTRNNQKQ